MTEWQTTKLGDLLRLKHGYAFKSAYFADAGTHIVLTPGNFYDEGGFKHKGDKEKWYDGPIPAGYILDKGSLIVAMTEQAEGLLGSSAIVPIDSRYLHNQRLGLVVDVDERRLDKHYLYYLFNTYEVRRQIRATANGAKVRHTSPARIYEVEVKLPPLTTQNRIASILSAYDDLIENNTRRIAILEEMARRLYEEWFVHFRFPGHEDATFTEIEDRQVPEGWETVNLETLAAVNPDSIKPKSAPGHINYIDIASVSPGRVDQTQPMAFSDAPGRARRRVQSGDVLWSCVRPNRRSHALILSPEQDTVASTGFAVLRATKVPYSYLYFSVRTDAFVDYLVNHATGAAYPAVKQSDFEAAKIIKPANDLLEKFNSFAEPLLLNCHTLQRKNANLRAQRELLLPKLVSGKIDVSDVSLPDQAEVAA